MLKILQFIPVQLVLFLILGILLGSYVSLQPGFLFVSLGFLIAILAISFSFSNKSFTRHFHFNSIVYLICILVGVTTVTIQNDVLQKSYYGHYIDQYHHVELTVIEVLKPSLFHDKYIATIQKLDGENVSGKVLLNIGKNSLTALDVDNNICLKGTFDSINRPLNPYYFDYRNYLSRKQIHHQITLNKEGTLFILMEKVSLNGIAARFRKRVNIALKVQGFQKKELAVMNALLLGQRNEVSKELLQSYANAGAIHILALSGLHVGIVLLILNFLLKPIERIKNGKFFKLILIVAFLWLFAFVAGMSPSIVRAVTMFTAVAIGWQSRRPTNVHHSLVISMLVLLLFRPSFLFEAGFQLSYLAVFSIVWIQPLLYRIWKPKLKVVDYFWQLLTVSVAAQFGILPLSLYYFHQFPGLFFLSNLIIIPVLGLILGFGFLIIILSFLDGLPSFLFKLYNTFIELMNAVVEWIGLQESFLFQDIPFSLLKMLVIYVLIVSVISFFEKLNSQRFTLLLIAVLMVQVSFTYEQCQLVSQNELVIFHKSRESIIAKKKGINVEVIHSLNAGYLNKENILRQYKMGLGSVVIESENEIPNITIYEGKSILVIDSLSVFEMPDFEPSLVLLRQSPKVNLNRVIELLRPQMIVADGSNYKSYVNRWEKTSTQKNTPFHYTGQKGAFILKK